MKLRILDDTIRIRISQSEMNLLAEGKAISTICHLYPNHLELEVLPVRVDDLSLSFENHVILLKIPRTKLTDLHQTDQVGFDHSFQFDDHLISLKFEKDFQCLTDRGEDESDLFENPLDKHDC